MISRRIFLKNGGLALVSLGFAPEFLARTVAAADSRRRVLVTIFQRGAVDGLNMIVPFGERYLGLTSDIPAKSDGTVDVLDFTQIPGTTAELGLMLFTNGDRGPASRGGATQATEALLIAAPGQSVAIPPPPPAP